MEPYKNEEIVGEVIDYIEKNLKNRYCFIDLESQFSKQCPTYQLIFKEQVGMTVEELSRTARDRRAGSLGYAEAILLIYNKKSQHPLRFEKLYTKKGKRSAKIEEQDSSAVTDEGYEDTSIPVAEGIEQMDLFNISSTITSTD